MDTTDQSDTPAAHRGSTVDRRSILRAGGAVAWTAPLIVMASTAPAMAASGTVTGVLDAGLYNPPEFPDLVWPSPRLLVTNRGATPTPVSVVITQRLTSGPDYTNYDPYTDNGVFGAESFTNYTGQSIDLLFSSVRDLEPGESATITAGCGWSYATSFDVVFSAVLSVPSPAQADSVAPDSVSYVAPGGRGRQVSGKALGRPGTSSRLPTLD